MSSHSNRKPKTKVIPLNLVQDAIEMADDEWNQYLDIEAMEVVSLPEYPFGGDYDKESQNLADMIEEEWQTRYFRLPSKYDIHEYGIMEEFIWSLPEGKVQDTLENTIRGKGAFRRFKDSICRFGIEQQWYDFQEAKYRELAIEWCMENDLAFSSDDPREETDSALTTDPENRKNVCPAPVSEGNDKDSKNLMWEEVRTEHIVQDEWIDFRRSAYRFPDGTVFEPYYSYSRRDYVVIVAQDEEGRYLCVRQFRQGIRGVTTEFPAGGIERTDGREYDTGRGASAAEDALAAAKRELLEETGYASEEWTHLLTVPSNATISDNYAHIFAAGNCRKAGGQHLDKTEFLNVRQYTAAELEEMIHKGCFQQAVHIMAWLLAQKG